MLTYQIYHIHKQRIMEKENLSPHHVLQHRSRIFRRWIKPVLSKLEGATFCVHLSDDPDKVLAEGMPNLCFCRRRDDDRDLRLIPDAHYQFHRGYIRKWKYRRLYRSLWEDKIPKAVFRGSCTGPKPLSENLRARLCSLAHPWIDARISMVNNGWEREDLKELLGRKMSEKTMARYKYQIDIDGNTNSWCGFFWKLMSGSLTFKVRSPWLQWYYDDIVDGVHYVGVETLEDLLEKMAYYREHDEQAREIGQTARLFTRDFLPEDQYRVFLDAVQKP